MANTDKDILITPNRGSTNEPKIEFKGASSTVGPSTITATIYPTNNGTLSFDGTEGSLFSIANNLTTGSIFSVNPISGIPIIDVNADRTIALNPYGGNTGIGLTNPSYKLDVSGTARFSGQLTIPGDNSITFGPNSTWSRYLRIGGNGWAADSTTASVVTTDGNLHLDAADANHGIYLNWYGGTNGTFFGNGAAGQIGRLDGSGNFSVSGTITGTQITSNIANGTAPFVVSSTTKVTNLNADYLDDLDSGSFLRSDADDSASGIIDFLGGSGIYPAVRVRSGGNSWSEGLAIHPASDNGYALAYFRVSATLTTNTNTWGIGNLADNGTNNFALIRNGLTGSSAIRADAAFDVTQAGVFRFGFTPTVGSNTIWHAGNAPRASNSYLMYYQGFTLDANTMDTNSTGFTYSVNAPATGPIVRFSTGGGAGYDLWLNAPYNGNGTNLYFRTRNGDTASLNSWHTIWNSGNDGSGSGLDADLIDGVPFNNSNNTNQVSAPDSLNSNGIGYVTNISLYGETDGALYSQAYSPEWQHQIYGDYRTGQIAIRGKNSNTWQSWRTVWDSGNAGSPSDYKRSNNQNQVNINSPASSSGSWTTASSDDEWGNPKFDGVYNEYRYADAPAWVQYNIPVGMKSAWISQLTWSSGGYVDIHGVQSGGQLVFLRRINTRQTVENADEGVNHDGSTVTFAASGLDDYSAIRFTVQSGRFHLTGLSFSIADNEGTEGVGMVHPAQISHQGAGSGLDADTVDGLNPTSANTASTIVARDASGNFNAGTLGLTGIDVYGANLNATNDATVYITATNNNDWGLIVNKFNGSATEYGQEIRVASGADYAFSILGSGTRNFRINGSGNVFATNFSDFIGSYNVNLGSGGMEGRGLVAGYSGGSYGGIGYNVRHTTTGGQWIAPFNDTSSYLLFNSAGFTFYGEGGGAAGRTLSYTTLATLSSAGSFTASGDLRAPIFRDSNDINYYADFANTGTSIVTAGNIGAKTTSPLQALDVRGNFLLAADATTATHITQKPYTVNGGTLSWEGSAGQLFSITNNLTSGSIFSVNDVSGLPSIDVDANGTLLLAPYGGNIGVGTLTPSQKLHVVGNSIITGSLGLGIDSTAAKLHTRVSTPTSIGSLPSGVTGILDSSSNNYLLFRNTADNGTYSGIAMQDNNVGGYVVFGNGGGGGDLLYVAGYGGGQLQYGTADSINPSARTTVASWNSTGLQINNGDLRAPIFYDSDNTGYYLNPASTSQLHAVQADSWFRPQNETGLYSQSYGQHFYPDSGGFYWDCDGPIRHRDGYEGTIIGYSFYHDGGGKGHLSANGNWWLNQGIDENGTQLVIGGSNNVSASTAATGRRLMFGAGNADARDNYYIGTNLENYGGNYNKLDLRWHTGIRMGAHPSYGGIRFYDTEALGTQIFAIGKDGSYAQANQSMRAPIFYDLDDTSYYLNPATDSFLRSVTIRDGGLKLERAYANNSIWFAGGTDDNHVLWNDALGGPGARGGSGFDGMKWNTYRGIYFRTGYGGQYNSLEISGSGASNDHQVYLYGANDEKLRTVTSDGIQIQRDLYISGSAGGNYGNRLIVGNTDTSYTAQDGNLRPTIQAHGAYPVVSLNHTVTGNAYHGPTLQFTCNGVGNQFVIGTNGTGTFLSMGYANAGDWNPHNGIAGYNGISFFHANSSGNIGLGAGGDWGAFGGGDPGYNLHFVGSNNGTNGHAAFFDNRVSATNSGSGFLFRNQYGNHSWGIVAEYRVEGAPGADRPSILFSTGYNSNTWSVGYGSGTDDNFRINYDHGHRNGSWGTTAVLVDRSSIMTVSGEVRAPIFRDSDNTGFYLDPASTTTSLQIAGAIEQGNNFAHPNIEWSYAGASTGRVVFKLPGNTGNYGMVHMVFDYYEYNSPRTATIIVSGHNWNGAWYNTACNVVGYIDKPVYLGTIDGQYCVAFGDFGSSWSYGTIRLRKIHNGSFYNNIMDLGGTYTATQITSGTFTNISSDLRRLMTSNAMYAYEYRGHSNVAGTGEATYHPAGVYSTGTNWLYGSIITNNNTINAGSSSVTASIFYDSDNTTYQFDGTGTTRLNTLRVFSNSAADWDAIQISTDGVSGYIQGLNDEVGLRLRSQNGNILLADDRGSVGIKNTSPLQALDVRGNFLLAADATTATHITQKPYTVNGGTLSWEGSEGQLFSIANNLTTGSIFSVNPISGIPIIDVNADRTIALNPYGGNTGIGLTNPSYKLDVSGTTRFSGASIFSSNISLTNGYIRAITNNQPAILSVASGTASSQASFAIQQETAEGWTGIFVDYEPYTGWGLYHDNPNNYFCITSEISTGSLRSFTVPSRVSGNRTAYEKIRFNQNDGSLIAGGEIQGTIFRDLNDTAYYVDPNNTSYLNLLRCNNWLYLDQNYGHSIVGAYASTRYQGVFAMGDAYKLPADGTTTGNLYGIAWSHPNAGGVASNLNTHGALILENGTFLAALSGSIRSRDDMRAPIFYDSNNTGYYIDPNNTSNLNGLTAGTTTLGDTRITFASGGGGFNFSTSHYSMGKDIANSAWSAPHYSDLIIGYHTGIRIGAAYSGIRFYNNSPTTDANNDGNGDGGEALLMTIGGYVGTANHTDVVVNNTLFANASLRSPILYDSNDTGYYVDPNGTSRIDNLYIVGGVAGVSNSSSFTEAAIEVRERGFGNAQDDTWATAPRIGFHWGGRVASQIALASNGRISILNNPGNGYENFQCNEIFAAGVIGDIFRDSADTTNLYADLSSTSDTAVRMNGGLWVSRSNVTGVGIVLADDGDIVDLNDGYCAMRFSSGVRIHSGNRTGSAVITLGSNGNVTATTFNGSLNGNASTASGLPTYYIGGQQTNPQTYFGQSVGLRVAMTGFPSAWADTLWINGYAGGDVLQMCALHTLRNGEPRMYISAQASNATSYGTTYEFLTTYNYNSYAPTLTGGGASGTWGINITGNAATATNISNSGTVTLASATESNSIYVSQPSYTTDQPVKLLNFDWYGNIWSLGNIRSGSTPSNGFGVYSSGTERARFTTSGLTVGGNVTASAFYGDGSNLTGITAGATLSASSGSQRVVLTSLTSGTMTSAATSSALTFDSSTGTLSSTIFTSTSDITKKTNIQNIKNAVDLTKQINGVKFDWKETGESSAGVIAQEVEEVLPEIVHTNDEGIKSVNYNGVVGLLVEAIKEQQKQIDELKKELKKLHK